MNTESSTKEALMASYKLYWQRQRGITSSNDDEDRKSGRGDGDNSDGVTKSERMDEQGKGTEVSAAKALREKFNDEKALLLEGRKQSQKDKKEQNKRDTQEWLGEREMWCV